MTSDAPKALDREEFLDRVEHDEELARELLSIFQGDARANREGLRAAIVSQNAADVQDVAHVFKGMLSNLAASRASEAASRLEMLAKSNALAELEPAWQVFDRELNSVFQEVEQFLAGTLQ